MWIIVSQGSKTLISFQYGGQFLNGQYYFLFNTYLRNYTKMLFVCWRSISYINFLLP